MQPWGAEETSFKNIKNLTDLKLLTGSVYFINKVQYYFTFDLSFYSTSEYLKILKHCLFHSYLCLVVCICAIAIFLFVLF